MPHLGHMLSMTFTYTGLPVVRMSRKCMYICIVGTVSGRGYNGQLKYTVCRACHSILSIFKPVFRQLRQIRCTYESFMCPDIKIWRFFVDDINNDDTTQYFTPCACARGNKLIVLFIVISRS